jgi:hypothetical protein
MKEILSLILLFLVLEGCVTKEIDFDVFDERGSTLPVSNK